MHVTLSWLEAYNAAQSGILRQIEALKHGRRPRYGQPLDDWGVNIEGCAAEMAVAKAYGLYWEPVARRPEDLAGDVSTLQIRSTWRENGRLIIHEHDPDDAPFILVTGKVPAFTIRGWIYGRDGKAVEFWDEGDGRAAYFVQQSALSRSRPPLGSGKVLPWPGSKSNTTAASSK